MATLFSSTFLDRIKALPLTIVLTVLLWMYAEAKFTSTQDNVRMVLSVMPPRADLAVRVFEPGENRRQDKVSLLMTLEGPKSQIDKIYQQSLGAMTLDPEFSNLTFIPATAVLRVSDDNLFDTVKVLNGLRYFQQRGVTVTAASPPQIRLEVDKLEPVQRPVEFHSAVPAERLASTPDQVTVSMPSQQLSEIGADRITVNATTTRDLSTLKPDQPTPITVTYHVDYPGPPDERITVEPKQGSITVRVARREGITESVPDVPLWVSGSPATLARYDADVRPKFVKVTLVGAAPAIQRFRNQLATTVRGAGGGAGGVRAFVDISLDDRPSDQYTNRRIRYVLPDGLSLQEGPTDADFRLIDRPPTVTPAPVETAQTEPAPAAASQPTPPKP